METVDITIIGAGVVGLAVAARLSSPRRSLVVLERHPQFGQETSSRNSEVIHSGIYYPPGTLKARLCVRGNGLLYEYCKKRGVAHERLGKLVVAANDAETEYLEHLRENGEKNGVEGLALLGAREVRDLEPEISAIAGLLVPSTGILDTHALMNSLAEDARRAGGMLVCGSEATATVPAAGGFTVTAGNETLRTKVLINCAGLSSDRVARSAGIDTEKAGYRLFYSKGQYFRPGRPLAVNRLVYPVPDRDGHSLGIHLTKDLAGNVRFGPDARYVDAIDYQVDEGRREDFARAVRRYLPSLDAAGLSPDTAGIRPRLQGPGGDFRDFVICHEKGRGLEGLVNLVGIESPGLTSCLAIAEHVERILCGAGLLS